MDRMVGRRNEERAPRPYRIVVEGTSLDIQCEVLAIAIRDAEMLMQKKTRAS
jgi:hypothetical protein